MQEPHAADLTPMNADLAPTTPDQRTWRRCRFAALWLGMAIAVLLRSIFGVRGARLPTLARSGQRAAFALFRLAQGAAGRGSSGRSSGRCSIGGLFVYAAPMMVPASRRAWPTVRETIA